MSASPASPGRAESSRRHKSPRDKKDNDEKEEKKGADGTKRSSSSRKPVATAPSEPVFIPLTINEDHETPVKPGEREQASSRPSSPTSERKTPQDRLRNASISQAKAAEEKEKLMTTGLSESRIKELKEAFSIFDKNGDGGISNDELRIFLETLGQKPSDKDIAMLMKEVDEDGNGEIDFDEFIQMMVTLLNPQDKEDDVAKVYAMFDPHKKGYIKADDLMAALTASEDALSVKDVEELIGACDKTSEGHIDFKSLVKLLVS